MEHFSKQCSGGVLCGNGSGPKPPKLMGFEEGGERACIGFDCWVFSFQDSEQGECPASCRVTIFQRKQGVEDRDVQRHSVLDHLL